MIRTCSLLLTLLFILISYPSLALAKNVIKFDISGISGDIQKNALNRLVIEKEAYGKKMSDTEIQEFFQNAPDYIRKAVEPFGYFKSHIQSHLSEKDSVWTASFHVELGPQIQILHVDLRILGPGKENPALTQFVRQFPIKPGQVFQTESYEKAKEELFQTANNEGYIKSYLERKEIRIDLRAYTVEIILILNTGPQYFFGEVNFKDDYEDNPFSIKFLNRFTPFHEDEPFSSQKLLQFQQDLSSSQYFKMVVVTPDFKHTENYHVPVKVSLSVPKAKQYNLGVGYGTFTGLRASAGINIRRITKSGHHFNAKIKYSSVLKGLAAKYFIPGKHPLTDQYTIGANIQRFTPKNAKSYSKSLSVGYEKTLGLWRGNTTLTYLNEQSINYDVTNPSYIHTNFLYPSLNISNIKADNLIYPRKGHAVNFNLRGTKIGMLSTTSFVQSEIKGKYIFSPTNNSRVIARGDFGYTVVREEKDLAVTLQFFAGGIDSIRGFPYDSIGPGKYLGVGSIEYQHQIVGNWNGAVFFDIGNVADNFSGPLNRGDGVGIVYESIIGPIKIYIARAESKKGKPKSIEFSIGSELS